MNDTVNTIDVIFKLVAICLSSIAILQLFEVRKKRHIDMFWKIYEIYTSDVQKKSRKDAVIMRSIVENELKKNLSKDEMIKFYNSSYHSTKDEEKKELDRSIMNRIRFFNQIGQLLKKKMINKDMLFELVGLGLEYDYKTFELILSAHRIDHNAPLMYSSFEETYKQYCSWKNKKIHRK